MSFVRRQYRCVCAALLLCAVLAVPVSAAEPSDDRLSFLETYRCTLADLLARVRAHRTGHDPYLILDLRDGRYVQCIFHDKNTGLYCEAASGWWEDTNHHSDLYFSRDQLAALAKLGFSTDGSHGNFKRDGAAPDDSTIADLMLTALYSGYGARDATPIEVEAPYATRRRGILRKNRCVPIS